MLECITGSCGLLKPSLQQLRMGIVKYQHLRRLPPVPGLPRGEGFYDGVWKGIMWGLGFSGLAMAWHTVTFKPTLPEGWEKANRQYRKLNKIDPIHYKY